MAREVIDLLSSPEQIAPARRKTTMNTEPSGGPQPAPPTKALEYNLPEQQRWVTLSSDDEAPVTKTTSKSTLKPQAIASCKPILGVGTGNSSKPPLSNTSIRDSGVYFHSDDFDTSVDLDASLKEPKSANVGVPGLNRKQMEEERLLRAKQRKAAEEARLQGANNSSAIPSTVSKPPYVESPKLRFHSSTFEKPSTSSNTSSTGGANFHSVPNVSDDIGDLDDDPFASSPPLKRRRLSSSPVASSSRITVSKASGYKRSISNFESSTKHNAAKGKAPMMQRSSTTNKASESDPIVFTSSPDHFADAKRKKEKKKSMSFSDDEDEDDIFEEPLFKKTKVPADDSDEDSDDSLPDISNIPAMTAPKASSKRTKSTIEKYETEKDKKKTQDEKASEKAQKEKERKAAKEAKDVEKEQKRLEKEEKAREKQAAAELAKVNTLKIDKRISALEMIVDLPESLDPKLSSQVRTFLGAHPTGAIEHEEYETSQPIIKWRRKVVTEYNEDLGYWDKVKPHITIEKHVMYVMTAKEFVDLATGEEGDELDLHVVQLKSQFESCKLIYLIEGLEPWKRKNKTLKERQFKSAVRSHAGQEVPSASQRPRKKKEAEYVDEEVVEDALLKLQMLDTKVHQTETMVVTAEWILEFTLHISTIPYKYETPLLSNECSKTL
jgi:crossover junction endonuclease EME1